MSILDNFIEGASLLFDFVDTAMIKYEEHVKRQKHPEWNKFKDDIKIIKETYFKKDTEK